MVLDSGARSAGFTLIELMFGILVAAIVVTLGVPNMTQLIRSNQVVNQTNSVLGAVQLARAESVKRGSGMAVCGSSDQAACDGEWGQGWLVFLDPDGSASGPAKADDVVRTAAGSAAIDDSSGGVVRFDHQGMRRAASESAIVIKRSTCGAEKARRIEIVRGGRASAEKVSC